MCMEHSEEFLGIYNYTKHFETHKTLQNNNLN